MFFWAKELSEVITSTLKMKTAHFSEMLASTNQSAVV
jgi:hypothetical protein